MPKLYASVCQNYIASISIFNNRHFTISEFDCWLPKNENLWTLTIFQPLLTEAKVYKLKLFFRTQNRRCTSSMLSCPQGERKEISPKPKN